MIKMEVFSGGPLCQGCAEILKLTDEYEKKYKGRLDIIRFVGEQATSRFDEYKLGCVPAVVINGKIRIEGICPSRETLDSALKEAGFEQDKD